MAATLQAVSADSYIRQEYPHSFHAGNGGSVTEIEEIKNLLGFDLAKTEQAAPRILAAFQEHGFSLYKPDEVDDYKSRQAKHAEFQAEKGVHRAHVLQVLFGFLTTLFGLGLLISGTAHFWYASISSLMWYGGGTLFVLSCVGVMVCSAYIHEYKHTSGYASAEWIDCSLQSFRDQPPHQVLILAAQIKRAIPNVDFTVSKLTVTKTVQERPIRAPLFDPILYASLPEEEVLLPVAIWDEPKFDGTPIMASSTSLD